MNTDKYVSPILADCTDDKMTAAQALEFLEEIVADLEGHIEALKEETGAA